MITFKAYFKKEIMESKRQYRYLILAIGIIAFAILDPVMVKILPSILEKQLQGDLRSLIISSPKAALNNYIKSLFQIGSLFIIFSFATTLSEEIYEEKLVFPYSKGSKPIGIVLAKIIHNTVVVTILIFIGFMICSYYASILLEGEKVPMLGVMNAAFLVSVYYFFSITLVTFLSSFVKKGIIAGFITIMINFLSAAFGNIGIIGKFVPYKLVEGANLFTMKGYLDTITFLFVFSLFFIMGAIVNMNKVEVI